MRRAYRNVAVAIALQEAASRGARKGGIDISSNDPSWFRTLNWAMDAITGNNGLRALRRKADADVTRGMAWGGFQPHFIVEREVITDKLRLPRFHHR